MSSSWSKLGQSVSELEVIWEISIASYDLFLWKEG